jgi:hypothetical protein
MTRCTMLGRGTTRLPAADMGNGFNEVWPATWVFVRPLVAVRDWTFLFGPGFMASINAVLLGTLLYKSRLVPRSIPTMGLIGAPLLLAANIATLFGHNEQTSSITMLATLPIAAWELSVGTWLLVKGFKPAPATTTATPLH